MTFLNHTTRADITPATQAPALPLIAPLARLRRLILFGLAVFTAGTGISMMFEILSPNGMTVIEIGILILFIPAFTWISLSFWTAIAGFLLRLTQLDPIWLRPQSALNAIPSQAITTRTAIVMPIYNEDTARVFAGLASVYESLKNTGEIDKFDFYVLSDSTDPAIVRAEQAGWDALRRRLTAEDRLFYRHRSKNIGRKAGNIADFCRRWGRHYDFMIVLDADSLMTGLGVLRLVDLMQATPHAGIIQTSPLLARQETFFGRFTQFATRLYSPMFATGMSFWQMGEANYWGHNAIIRVAAFTETCGLPVLPGHPPFGGEILSHDFVEAALLRRRGWRVYMLPDIEGSYEEAPGNILDFAKRDHRWAQGNLQHLKLLAGHGLHAMSRFHFLSGAFAYLSSLFWLALLVLSTGDILGRVLVPHEFFDAGHQLFPNWLVVRYDTIVSLLTFTLTMLLLPKFLALFLALADRRERYLFGGTLRLLMSTVTEIVFAAVIAPLMMCLHAWFVVTILAGRSIAWMPQNRGNSERLDGGKVTKVLLAPTLLGLAWGGLTLVYTPDFFWCLTPVLLGMVVAIPLTVFSSSLVIGRRVRRWGLFGTPEEYRPPAEIDFDVADVRVENGQALAEGEILGMVAAPPEIETDMPVQSVERPAPRRSSRRAVFNRPI
jgi:membrane glycosyltransferase